MILQEILDAKGNNDVQVISPNAKLDEVAETLVKHRIGSLLIAQTDSSGKMELLGIVTERDILYHCARGNLPLAEIEVSKAMSSPLITASPNDSVEQVMGLMTGKRIRHLPVISEGQLIGIVSIGDLVKVQFDNLAVENRFMKDYIQK